MKNIGIIGLGLIGGSLAKAFKEKKESIYITAYNRSEKPLIKAFKEKIVDRFETEINESFSLCDIIFICTTVDTIGVFVEKLKPYIKKDCILTDVGSTKVNIFNEMSVIGNINFIGGHPMAGSEKTGYEASKSYLFENAYYVLTPEKNITQNMLDDLISLVREIGALPIVMEAEKHDEAVSAISHTPHIIAAALVNSVRYIGNTNSKAEKLAAGGFKDITRISSSSPSLWNSICKDNKEKILKMLNIFKKEINAFETALTEDNDLTNLFESAKNYRDNFSNTVLSYMAEFKIKIDILDKKGSIATVTTALSVNNINIKNIAISNSREYEGGIMQIVFNKESDMLAGEKLLREMNYDVLSRD